MTVTFKVLLLLVFGFGIGIVQSQPQIIPEESEQTIGFGSSYTLTCKCSVPITWTYPTIENGNETLKPEVHITSEEEEDGNHISRLHITNASDLAVGYYFCNETNDKDNYASTYLYVDGGEKLYVGTGEIIVASGKQFSALIIPCRPTSPSVTVKLYEGVGTENKDEYTSFELYDPKIGFLLSQTRDVYYTCEFAKGNNSVTILVVAETPQVHSFIREPVVRHWDDTLYNIEHEDLHLTCEVEIEQGQATSFSWMFNGTTLTNDTKYTVVKGPVIQQNTYSNLTVRNISKYVDSGNYTCVVDDSDNKNEKSLLIDILPKGTHFLYLSETNGILNNTCTVPCKPIVWNINVTSYPRAKITWFDNRRKVISKGIKYNFTNSNKESVLVINNVTVDDRGNFTIKAENKYNTETLTVHLNVEDKPRVRIVQDNFHLPNEEEQVRCRVSGNPKPEIKWAFKECMSCDYKPIKSNESVDGLIFVSIAKIKTNQSGYIQCYAKNIFGEDQYIADYTVSDVKRGFDVVITEDEMKLLNPNFKNLQLAVNDVVSFECMATTQNYTDLKWYLNGKLMDHMDDRTQSQSSTVYSFKKHFTIDRLNFSDAGTYQCQAQKKQGGFKTTEIHVKVIEPGKPRIVSSNMNGSQQELIYPISHNFTCNYDGVPRPSIIWYKDNQEVDENDRIRFYNNKQMLKFISTEQSDEGDYSCRVENRVDYVIRTASIVFTNKTHTNTTIYIVLAVFAVAFLILCISLAIKIRKERELQKVLRLAGLQNFEKGAVDSINPDLGIDDQAELLPYDRDSWEIPKDRIKLGKQLGAGAFGVVMKAIIEKFIDNETDLTVAVKMIKKTADDTYLRALVSELKIMVHLGKHLNVVNLIGACTKHIVKRELYVIVEFCRFGNLHNYLLRHRENFINQIDPVTGKTDYTIGADILSRSFSVSSSHSQEGPPKDMMDYRGNSNYNGPLQTQTTEVTLVSMSPTGGSQGDDPLMSNNSIQPEWRSNYKGDYKGNVKPICTKDLLTWAFQVSRGMEYLSSRKVLHGDLAARNILLADNNIVKICDFGLAKSMYKSGNYKKKGDGPLPIKWMSVESIRDKVFSTQSDVWSFGIVLWEFFSLARTPYPGMEADERLFQKLVDGYRMDSPTYATKEIYDMMSNCWEPRPLDRPSFGRLSEKIGSMLEESVKKHYIDLNDPYLVMNTERFQNGHSDYLKMVSPPDFEKLSSPHYVNDISHAPNTATSDYMPMKSGQIFSPRENDGEVFIFSNLNNKDMNALNVPELTPMLRQDSDYETQPNTPKSPELPSYANPMYNKIDFPKQNNIIVNTPDNYVNMPKNKSAMKIDKDDFVKDDSHYVNNVSRDWEKVQ